jgi:hypothetical protein
MEITKAQPTEDNQGAAYGDNPNPKRVEYQLTLFLGITALVLPPFILVKR